MAGSMATNSARKCSINSLWCRALLLEMALRCRLLSKPTNCPRGWLVLKNDEDAICRFGRRVLDAIGFTKGVFHIEGREQHTDGSLRLIEVNSRAPGGSLWKLALLRTGYDLELVDAMIQLDIDIPSPERQTQFRSALSVLRNESRRAARLGGPTEFRVSRAERLYRGFCPLHR
jgi:hypothetical protein